MHYDDLTAMTKASLRQLVEAVVSELTCEIDHSLLLGSWAHGNATNESDFDIRLVSSSYTKSEYIHCRQFAKQKASEYLPDEEICCMIVAPHQVFTSNPYLLALAENRCVGFGIDSISGARYATHEEFKNA